jgi:hypothetical protein
MNIVRFILWISRLAGLGATILGLLHWLDWFSLIALHRLFGFLVALTLLILSIVVTFTKRMKLPGILGITLALVIPVLGTIQTTLLIGNLHWLIQATHLLIGVVAVATTQMLGRRYEQFKQAAAKGREFAQD